MPLSARPLAWILLAPVVFSALPAWSGPATPAGTDHAAEPVRNSDLDASLLYEILNSELQWHNRDPGAAYSLMADAARRHPHPDLFRRALQMAIQGRAGQTALETARLWSKAFPSSEEPHRMTLQLLVALNRTTEMATTLRQLIVATPADQRPALIASLPALLARSQGGDALLKAVREGLQASLKAAPTRAAASTTIGRLEWEQRHAAQALEATQQALAADSGYLPALALALELFEARQTAAEPLILAYLERPFTPSHAVVELGYVRSLIELKRWDAAGRRLEAMVAREPDAPAAWLLLGHLRLQTRALDAAETALQRYLSLNSDSDDAGRQQAFLLLSRVAEQRQDLPAAQAWLDRMDDTNVLLSTQFRRALLMGRQGQVEAAREWLRSLPERGPDDARRKRQAEAQLLRDLGQLELSLSVYAQAVAEFPDDQDLRYEQAMVADKAGHFDQMEAILRDIMARQPDYHHAYNALGYALADRGERLPEALKLIRKALDMAPNDPYILDSLGWVQFRMGDLSSARHTLQRAYQAQPDAEIGAHWGEVLWQSGERDAALKLWREGLQLDPDNRTLQQTLQRLKAQP